MTLKQKTIDELTRCFQCGDEVKTAYTVVKSSEPFGLYCSRKCAYSDNWGPTFNDSRIRKLGTLKVEIT